MKLLSYIFGGQPTYADLANHNPKLLSGAWSLCAHKKGFWASGQTKPEIVADDTGSYIKLVGDCKACLQQIVTYRSME